MDYRDFGKTGILQAGIRGNAAAHDYRWRKRVIDEEQAIAMIHPGKL